MRKQKTCEWTIGRVAKQRKNPGRKSSSSAHFASEFRGLDRHVVLVLDFAEISNVTVNPCFLAWVFPAGAVGQAIVRADRITTAGELDVLVVVASTFPIGLRMRDHALVVVAVHEIVWFMAPYAVGLPYIVHELLEGFGYSGDLLGVTRADRVHDFRLVLQGRMPEAPPGLPVSMLIRGVYYAVDVGGARLTNPANQSFFIGDRRWVVPREIQEFNDEIPTVRVHWAKLRDNCSSDISSFGLRKTLPHSFPDTGHRHLCDMWRWLGRRGLKNSLFCEQEVLTGQTLGEDVLGARPLTGY